MKDFVLDGPSASPAPDRNAIYWRAWEAVEKARPGTNRFGITRRVLGGVVKIAEMTDDQFKKLIRAFGHIAKRKKSSNTEKTEVTEPLTDNSETSAISAASCETPRSLSEFQATELNRREGLLMQLAELLDPARKGGAMSLNRAAKILGEPASTLCVWRQAFARDGRDGLIPRQADKCGRKPLAVLSAEHQRLVQSLTLATDPNDGATISVSMALRMFAQDDRCPEDVAAVIQKQRSSKHTLTPTLKRQARVTPETKMRHRGDRNFSLGAYSQPRKLTWRDAGGTELPILGGDIFEPDDMTLNQPWFVEWAPEPAQADGRPRPGADLCAHHFGVRLLRGQLLVMIDVGTQRILGFLLLARQKDSYRAEDIWSWFGQIFADYGLPRVGIRTEGGSWFSNMVRGIPVVDQAWGTERRLGGLSEIGVRQIRSYTPKTKSIEALFNQLQKVLGVLGVQVGRKRGEFEKPTRDYLACRAGKKHPKDCGFLHADEIAKRIANACMFLNGDCREGEIYRGIPDELWQRAIVAAPLSQVPASKAWIFMPQKRELTIGNGMVRARFAEHECSYYFTHPELFASLGRGYRVVVCFDPGNPEQGAVIFNNETGPRAHTGAGPGELLGVAEFVDRVPQFSALDGFDDERGYERRRRFTAQCRKHYRAIPLPGSGPDGRHGRGSSATIARDGRGNETRIEFAGAGRSGTRGDPAAEVFASDLSSHASPAAPATTLNRTRGKSARPASDFDEEAELSRIGKLERAAIDRGEILIT